MKSSILAAGAILLAAVSAQPHRNHHRHNRLHEKRGNGVVWVTDIVEITETVLLTATVWVDENGSVLPEVRTGTSTATGKPVTSHVPGEFFETAKTSTVTPTPKTSTTTIQVSSVIPPAPVVPSPSPVVLVAPAPVVPSPVAPVPTTTPPAPAATTPAAPVVNAPAAPAGSSGGASVGGVCSSGSPCSGDITYYEAGLGACGITNNGAVDMIIALPWELMGTQSNGNPYCGKTVTISKGGKTIQATVQDKCMGCTGKSIDLSNAAFSALGVAYDTGRTTADWWFN